MRFKNQIFLALGAVGLCLGAFVLSLPAATPSPRPGGVRIGLVSTLFRDIAQPTAHVLMAPLGSMMEAQTGVKGELMIAGDHDNLAEQLAANKIQLGVFHGVEFAWARMKYPDLRPLAIAVNESHKLRAHLVVRDDCKAECLADLKGQTLAMPSRSREHCYLFVQRQCEQAGCKPEEHFADISKPANVGEALDNVAAGAARATVVDDVALRFYREDSFQNARRLKSVQVSEAFPAGTVAYRKGTLDEVTLKRFRDGLLRAHTNRHGQHMLSLWRLTSFQAVPAEYEQMLTEIAKAYPPPSEEAK
jgi:ABC-type phosphate/phosphonate transport system substrate-binding protein